MNDQLECATVAQSNGREMTHIACHQSTDTKRLGECDDGAINEAKAEVGKVPIHFHRT